MFSYPKKNPPPPSSKPIINNKQPNPPHKNIVSNFISNAMSGFSFGIGSSIARDMVSKISNSNSATSPGNSNSNTNINHESTYHYYPNCKPLKEIYEICMSNKDLSDCKYLLKEYQECMNKNN